VATLNPNQVAQLIVDCALAHVQTADPNGIDRHGVVVGAEIADDDCQCGQLVIAEQRRYPSRDFPLEEVDHTAECGEPWIVVQYVLRISRCVPVPNENGVPPSIVDLSAAATLQSDDMTKIRNAVYCCLTAEYDPDHIDAFQLGSQEVTGPSGGCAGSELTIMVGWTNDCGC